jgi:hypothetical protein
MQCKVSDHPMGHGSEPTGCGRAPEFLWKLRWIRSPSCSGVPLTGWRPNLRTYGTTATMSYTMPSSVQTGSSKGVKLMAQQLKGRRANGAPRWGCRGRGGLEVGARTVGAAAALHAGARPYSSPFSLSHGAPGCRRVPRCTPTLCGAGRCLCLRHVRCATARVPGAHRLVLVAAPLISMLLGRDIGAVLLRALLPHRRCGPRRAACAGAAAAAACRGAAPASSNGWYGSAAYERP